MPVPVVVEKIITTQGHLGSRIDSSGLKEQDMGPPGVKKLDEGAVPPLGPLWQTYRLAGDNSGTIATFGLDYEQSSAANFEVGIKTPYVELGLTSKATLQTPISLTFKLRWATA